MQRAHQRVWYQIRAKMTPISETLFTVFLYQNSVIRGLLLPAKMKSHGLDLPSHWKTKQKSHETMVFKTVDTSQQRMSHPRDMASPLGEPYNHPRLLLREKVQTVAQRGRTPGRLGVFLSLGEGAGCPGGQEGYSLHSSRPDRRGLQIKRATEIYKGLSSGIWPNPYQPMFMRK